MIVVDKLLVLSVSDEVHGCTLTLKASTAVKPGKIIIKAEDGVYDIEELKEAIKQIEAFKKEQEQAKEQAECEAQGITEVHA
jgi:hypothetical protein